MSMIPTTNMMNAKIQKKIANGKSTKPRNPKTRERMTKATPPPVLTDYTGVATQGFLIQRSGGREAARALPSCSINRRQNGSVTQSSRASELHENASEPQNRAPGGHNHRILTVSKGWTDHV